MFFIAQTLLFVHFFHHMLQRFPSSLSLSRLFCRAPFHSSLSQGTARLWRTSFHCIRNWYLHACVVTRVCLGVLIGRYCPGKYCVSPLGYLPVVIWLNRAAWWIKELRQPSVLQISQLSGLAQWHENKLKLSQMRSFGLFPDCSSKQARRQLVPTSWSLIRRFHPLRICLSHFEIQVVKINFVSCKNRFSSTCVSRFQFAAL